jgi:HTH-type transcriptional regulator/antitoxin HigA
MSDQYDDLDIHPGETLQELLEIQNLSAEELALKTNVSPSYINQILNGERDITHHMAVALEEALGVDKMFWINLQALYDDPNG